MNNRIGHSFKSYIDIDESSQNLDSGKGDSPLEPEKPTFLEGELMIAVATSTLFYERLNEWKKGCCGTLYVTNFRLSFHSGELSNNEDIGCQKNSLLDDMDIPLSNIDMLFQVSKNKKRRLVPGENISMKVKGLQIVCKNMKVLTFCFKNSPVNCGKNVTMALLHHAFPKKRELLFAYDFVRSLLKNETGVRMFELREDWCKELQRTKCSGWRVSRVNEVYLFSPTSPAYFVVPETVTDKQIEDAGRHFEGSRPLVWCWGNSKGAALVRVAEILSTITQSSQENATLEQIRKVHPEKKMLYIMELQRTLPSPKDVQQSFNKLRELLAPESAQQFQTQERTFWGLLDATRWLHIISDCLKHAVIASKKMSEEGRTVVLREGSGRDFSAVVSSLAQLLSDPSTRSILGFQSLIQKEWVALGHPFGLRLGNLMGSESEQSPIFLVFLDCVWQLLHQFPSEFEFTETYLTTLWDSSHLGIFDPFIFDCERDRKIQSEKTFILRSVWDWSEQFGDPDIALFRNPLYNVSLTIDGVEKVNGTVPAPPLPACGRLPSLDIWMQCYCRWLPVLEIVGGGRPQVNFQIQLLIEDINSLRLKLMSLKSGKSVRNVRNYSSDDLTCSSDSVKLRRRLKQNPNSFFPFAQHGACSTELLLEGSFLGEDGLQDIPGMMESSFSITDD